MQRLVERGLISADERSHYQLTNHGRDLLMGALAACKAVQEDLIDRIGAVEVTSLRNLLKRVILDIDPGLPKVWE